MDVEFVIYTLKPVASRMDASDFKHLCCEDLWKETPIMDLGATKEAPVINDIGQTLTAESKAPVVQIPGQQLRNAKTTHEN